MPRGLTQNTRLCCEDPAETKAIYENTATGYLSSKQSPDGASSFFELTKFITDNKQS